MLLIVCKSTRIFSGEIVKKKVALFITVWYYSFSKFHIVFFLLLMETAKKLVEKKASAEAGAFFVARIIIVAYCNTYNILLIIDKEYTICYKKNIDWFFLGFS